MFKSITSSPKKPLQRQASRTNVIDGLTKQQSVVGLGDASGAKSPSSRASLSSPSARTSVSSKQLSTRGFTESPQLVIQERVSMPMPTGNTSRNFWEWIPDMCVLIIWCVCVTNRRDWCAHIIQLHVQQRCTDISLLSCYSHSSLVWMSLFKIFIFFFPYLHFDFYVLIQLSLFSLCNAIMG